MLARLSQPDLQQGEELWFENRGCKGGGEDTALLPGAMLQWEPISHVCSSLEISGHFTVLVERKDGQAT